GVDQFLKGLLHQVTEQEPDLVTAKLRDELSQSGIMALGHRVSPFESTADELAEDSTVAPSDHGSTYTTRWDAYPRRSEDSRGNGLAPDPGSLRHAPPAGAGPDGHPQSGRRLRHDPRRGSGTR